MILSPQVVILVLENSLSHTHLRTDTCTNARTQTHAHALPLNHKRANLKQAVECRRVIFIIPVGCFVFVQQFSKRQLKLYFRKSDWKKSNLCRSEKRNICLFVLFFFCRVFPASLVFLKKSLFYVE